MDNFLTSSASGVPGVLHDRFDPGQRFFLTLAVLLPTVLLWLPSLM